MLFKKEDDFNKDEKYLNESFEYEYKNKYGFLNELKDAVRTDEEYAKFKGYM